MDETAQDVLLKILNAGVAPLEAGRLWLAGETLNTVGAPTWDTLTVLDCELSLVLTVIVAVLWDVEVLGSAVIVKVLLPLPLALLALAQL